MNNNNRQILNRNVMYDLIGEDHEQIRKFEIQFLHQAKDSIAKIANSFRSSEFGEIKEEAHFLKTSAKAVGAEQTADLLESLEAIALEKDIEQCKEHIILINRAIKQVYGAIKNEQ